MTLVIYNRMLLAMVTVGGSPKFYPPWISLLMTDMSDDWKASGTLLTPTDPGYLSMCLTVKDEHIDIIENIEYHRKVGVTKIYIIDTGSVPPLKSLLLPYIVSGLVVHSYVLFPWHNIMSVFMATPSPQELTQNLCLQWWGPRHKFMAFTDVDEFIVVAPNVNNNLLQHHRSKQDSNSSSGSSSSSSSGSSRRSRNAQNSIRSNNNSSLQAYTRKHSRHRAFVPSALEPYERYGGLAVNWMVFGSSGHVSRPNGTVLSSYTKCAPSATVKSIVVTEHTLSASPNPHWFHYKHGYHAVNERGDKVDAWANDPPTVSHIYINHYATKSLEDFQRKMKRGSATRAHKRMSEFERFNAMATEICAPPTLSVEPHPSWE